MCVCVYTHKYSFIPHTRFPYVFIYIDNVIATCFPLCVCVRVYLHIHIDSHTNTYLSIVFGGAAAAIIALIHTHTHIYTFLPPFILAESKHGGFKPVSGWQKMRGEWEYMSGVVPLVRGHARTLYFL